MAIRDSGRRLRLRQTDRVPPDADVVDYDELSEREQAVVRELAGGPWTAPEPEQLDDGDVVRFTEYYRVRAR